MFNFRLVALAAFVAASPAAAVTNLVTNGGFETGFVFATEFNTSGNPSFGPAPTGWSSSNPFAFNLYLDSATATTAEAMTTVFPKPGQKLHSSFTGASPDGGKFVALNGDSNADGAIFQTIDNLVVGEHYTVYFYWAAAQLASRKGATTEQLEVSFGGVSQKTAVINNPSQGFSGWIPVQFKYTATSTSQILSFLSIGTPNGLPPVALLDGVALVSGAPEPSTWGLMIVGFGLVGVAARRRARQVVVA